MCQKHDIFGFRKHVNGGMAEYMRIPKEALVYKISNDMSIEKAVLIEPYSCAKHAVDRADISNEDIIVISGAGTLGLAMPTIILSRPFIKMFIPGYYCMKKSG